jgi:hypothetical protein
VHLHQVRRTACINTTYAGQTGDIQHCCYVWHPAMARCCLPVCPPSAPLQEGDLAVQLYYIRPRFGDFFWDSVKATKLRVMLEAAIQRRFPKGLKVCCAVVV